LKSELETINKQSGGSACMMPIFQEENDPNIIVEEVIDTKNGYKKDTYKKKDYFKKVDYEKPPINPEKDLLVDLQIFNQPQKPKSKFLENKMNKMPHPVAVMTPYIPPQYGPYLGEVMKDYQKPFIYKDYHINLGPESNHTLADKIYTDALPVQSALIAYKSLKERNYLANHIRSTFINGEEGELVSFTERNNPGVNINCIVNRLKLMELSPFNNNLFSKNPYDTMVQGLLVYRSCYPIEYDSRTNSAICAKNSTGINVRIYALTDSDYSIINTSVITKEGKKIEIELFDRNKSLVWREIDYYRFIREEIAKKYVCPNFIQSYCYFLNEDVNLNFEKNALMKSVKKYSKYSIVLLTESPNDSLYSWVGNKYQQDFKNPSVNNMVKAGIKKDEDWKSILFQMLTVFYIMYEYNFVFRDIDVSKNFYIKNINFSKESTQYWIYNINGIEYYVPNYGYLLLFDTYYCNKSNGNNIIASFIDGDDKIKDIKEIILNNAVQVFSINNFTEILEKMGGVKPSQEILNLINNISNSISRKTVSSTSSVSATIPSTEVPTTISTPEFKNIFEEIILDNFYSYLNNRIGTKLYDSEISGIIGNSQINKKGDLILKKESIGTDGKFMYNIGLYTCNNNENKCKCIMSINPNKREEELSKVDIYSLSSNDIIKQKFTSNNPAVSSIENLIETYRLSKN
jgi:hypothetical protein